MMYTSLVPLVILLTFFQPRGCASESPLGDNSPPEVPPQPLKPVPGCKDGETKTLPDGCDRCHCIGGSWQCVNGGWCLPGNTSPPVWPSQPLKPEPDCKDGETTTAPDGCNSCYCNGGRWACTKRGCFIRKPDCKDGETTTAPDGCNSCYCNGGRWACTKRGCFIRKPGTNSPPEVTSQPLKPEPECKDGETTTAPDGCNSCYCNGGRWACTKRGCPIRLECKDGETREYKNADDSCTFCECDGGGFRCQDRECISKPVTRSGKHLLLDLCEIQPNPGPCRAAIPRFFFNITSAICEKFDYGGCRGNANNFPTEEECNNRCLKQIGSPVSNNCDENGNVIICAADARLRCGSDGIIYIGSCGIGGAKCKNPDLTEIQCTLQQINEHNAKSRDSRK